jgi:hypothetical protein
MRNITRAAVIFSSLGAALTLGNPSAYAGPNPSMVMSAPNVNTAVVSITNNLTSRTRCGARLYGFEEYDTPYTDVAPQSTITFTMTNVPAGNYSVWWACNGHTGDKRLMSIGGEPQLNGKPQTAVSHG